MYKKKAKYFILLALIIYISIELVCFVFIKANYIPAKFPSFYRNSSDTMTFPFPYADINQKWGVWHYDYPVNTPVGCLNVECTPNSYGARDKERRKIVEDKGRCIVLGDSFMEGYGIDIDQRLSNRLEQATKKEFLNFACSDMGSTQEYLVYKELASSFTHDYVLLGILPANDFLNDNMEFDKGQTPKRYKPYWKGNYPDMQIHYYVNSLHKTQFSYEAYKDYKSKAWYKVREFLENTTCWFNVLYFISRKKSSADFVINKAGNKLYSGYYDYDEREFERLKQSLESIRQIARDKTFIIFTIPVRNDYLRRQSESGPPPLISALQYFCQQNDIIYKDLFSNDTSRNWEKNYFDCDMHWNKNGNEYAFKQIFPFFEGIKKGEKE